MTAAAASWRRMEARDLDGVVRVARMAFPEHFEDRACFAERHRLYSKGCFVLAQEQGEVLGYLIAYPWLARSAPPLNSLIGGLPSQADILYLHDLALHSEAQGRGHTRTIVERLAAEARANGWNSIALVAVNRATAFWMKMGFAVMHDRAMVEKLASYGADADYMVRRL